MAPKAFFIHFFLLFLAELIGKIKSTSTFITLSPHFVPIRKYQNQSNVCEAAFPRFKHFSADVDTFIAAPSQKPATFHSARSLQAHLCPEAKKTPPSSPCLVLYSLAATAFAAEVLQRPQSPKLLTELVQNNSKKDISQILQRQIGWHFSLAVLLAANRRKPSCLHDSRWFLLLLFCIYFVHNRPAPIVSHHILYFQMLNIKSNGSGTFCSSRMGENRKKSGSSFNENHSFDATLITSGSDVSLMKAHCCRPVTSDVLFV